MLSTRPLKETGLNNNVVDKIKALALANDEDGVRALLRTRHCGSEEIAQAIYQLSITGGRDAIEFLHPLLRDYPLHIDRLVQMHAACGYISWVEDLLKTYHADINSAVTGYASAGLWMRVNALLARGAEKSCAIYGYAAGGHVHLIEAQIGDDIEPYIPALTLGFAEGGHFATADSLMRLLSSSNREDLRHELRFRLEEKFPDQAAAIYDKAIELNRIKRKYQMKYEMALELYDEVKAVEARHQPWFYARFFSSDNNDVQQKINADVLGLMNKYDESHPVVALKR